MNTDNHILAIFVHRMLLQNLANTVSFYLYYGVLGS